MSNSTRKVKLARGNDAPFSPVRFSCAIRCSKCGIVLFTAEEKGQTMDELTARVASAQCQCEG